MMSIKTLPTTLFVVLLISARPLFAEQLSLIDRDGNPLSGAVVTWSVPEGSSVISKDVAELEPAVIDQIGKRFIPQVMAIQQGQSVVFPNSDQVRHHVYSFSKPKTFEIKLYKGASPETIVFDKPGLVVLGCNIHDSMVGYIYVSETPMVAVSNERGQLQLMGELTRPKTVSIWHPWLNQNGTTVDVDIHGAKDGIIQIDVSAPRPRNGFQSVLSSSENEYQDF